MNSSADAAFELLRSQAIDSLNITVEEYRHRVTGAQHIHLCADNSENVFLVALRTVPHDSTGVAHILEHTALCGSERYPVRDPFFMMIRRSLNTFMNAFTSSDWTAYPFASQNRKDFNNLLDVYLDAVFFSRLDELDFLQEGHRLEFAEPENQDSPLVYKGIVYNEMKGAMSSVPSQLWQNLSKYLFPTSTYHYNSGGDPQCITDLSYEQLQHFYRTHYHPSNAIFMTYGDIPAAEHQDKFQTQALGRFQAVKEQIAVSDEKRYYAPIRVEEAYPLEEEQTAQKTHVVLGWLLGKTTNLEDTLRAQLLTNLLFDNSSSPLQFALETTELGNAPSPLCGLDDSQKELTFVCGLEGTECEHAQALENLVLNTLHKVCEEGIDKDQLDASLHQLELQQREIGGDGYPYGLQLILTALTAATHRGDPIGLLNLDPALEKLRRDCEDPEFIPSLIQELLLNNPHRVRLTLRPDQNMEAKRQQAEQHYLEQVRQSLSQGEKNNIVEKAKALQQRQLQVDDSSLLPKVGLEDIPAEMKYTPGTTIDTDHFPLSKYAAGTNGLVYQQFAIPLPDLSGDELELLPYYCMCLTELGMEDKDYLQVQRRQAQVVGSISAYASIRGKVDDPQNITAYVTLSAKALAKNQEQLCELLWDTLHNVRFDEHPRLRELISQNRARREQNITGAGQSLAMAAAASGISTAAAINHQLNGLQGIQTVKQLDSRLNDNQHLSQFSQDLQNLHHKLVAGKSHAMVVAEQEHLEQFQQTIAKVWQNKELTARKSAGQDKKNIFQPEFSAKKINQAWITNTQVHFCSKAYPSVPQSHPDAAPLTVLGGFLRNGYLHRAIREQGGAYGGGANQDSNGGSFRFFSYRDPRLLETLEDFDQSIHWLLETDHEWAPVEEAIMGVISSIDSPSSPAGEAKHTFHAERHGRSREIREQFRANILTVTQDDLKRVARSYLKPELANTAVITHQGMIDTVKNLGLDVINL